MNDLTCIQGGPDIKALVDDAKQPEEKQEAALERLSKLSPLEYDRVRQKEADKLGVRTVTLDKEVQKLRPLKANEEDPSVIFPEIEPYGEEVDLADLLDDIGTVMRRVIICDDETVIATSLWIAFTWFIDRMQVAPIALITAPEMQCGKTQLLTFIGETVYRPLPASNISSSAVFRSVDAFKPTLLLDEADSFFKDKEELRGIINSGHTRQSAFVIRNVGDDHEPKKFNTFGAKAICGIGKQAPTIMDRSIVLELRRKLSSEKTERLRHIDRSIFEQIRMKLARVAKDHGELIEGKRPLLPDALSDRAQDNWEPLLAIADIAGKRWPETARNAAIKISCKSVGEDSASPGVMLLEDIQSIFESERTRSQIFTADLLKKLHAMDDRPWPEWYRGNPITARQVARHLKPFGINSGTIRSGAETAKGYQLKDMLDAFTRYLSDTEAQPLETKGYSEKPYVTWNTAVTLKDNPKPSENITCDAVTLETGVAAEEEIVW